ncbi:MAG: GatB/YqeY domain-containing protein [Planctomycetes bacterium]|nr:GatB/YqeY domain-containing protein [Planctomycetota bacterium]
MLKQKLGEDVKTAMKAGQTLERDTLRLLQAEIQKREVALGRDLTPEEQLDACAKAVKTRQESIEQFDKAGRKDLADKERAEMAVLQRYLPKVLDEAQTRALVQGLIAELKIGAKKDLGVLMKALLARHKGEVDGKLVQKVAGELLT